MGMAAFFLGLAAAPLALSSAFVPSLGEKTATYTYIQHYNFWCWGYQSVAA